MIITQTTLQFNCIRCPSVSPVYNCFLSVEDSIEKTKQDILNCAELARGAGWLMVDTEYTVCNKCFQKTLRVVRDISELNNV